MALISAIGPVLFTGLINVLIEEKIKFPSFSVLSNAVLISNEDDYGPDCLVRKKAWRALENHNKAAEYKIQFNKTLPFKEMWREVV